MDKDDDGIGLPIAMCMEREKLWGENMKKKIGRFLKIFAFCALLAVSVAGVSRLVERKESRRRCSRF